MGSVKLIDSSFAVAKDVKELLLKKGLDAGGRDGSAKVRCFVSDDVEGFRKNAGMFFKEKIEIKKAVL